MNEFNSNQNFESNIIPNKEIYEAIYVSKDGRRIEIHSSLLGCSNWADNVLRYHGEGTITVRKLEND